LKFDSMGFHQGELQISRLHISHRMSQLKLVQHLKASGAIQSKRVEACMAMVDRRFFIPQNSPEAALAYEDRPLPIGMDQTISAPHMHAHALEVVHSAIKLGSKVLDVGSGSGYLVSCLALLTGPTGFVLGIEKMNPLAERSVSSIKRANPELAPASGSAPSFTTPSLPGCTLMGSGLNWQVWHGNALDEEALGGFGEDFDAIHVGAAAESIPENLCNVLARGGKMVLPVGRRWETQSLMLVEKDGEGKLHTSNLMGVIYVPLTRPGEA
jgi:protein-L-isoaspartate(D-aspartate) O-methyltransferase